MKKTKPSTGKHFSLLNWLLGQLACFDWSAQKLSANRIVHFCEKYKRNDYFIQINEKNMVVMNTLLLNLIHGSE